MRAHARLEVAATTTGGTQITGLRSDPPLVLRPALGPGGAARVWVAAGAAGPIGGDRLTFEIDVGAGATLVLRTVAASLVLPGAHGERSRLTTNVRVAAGATFVWLPQPVIAAARCRHETVITISLDEGAQLVAREELVLGRHGESPGSIRQRLRVTLAARPLFDQELCIGSPAWDGPAVTGGRGAAGTLLVVDPALAGQTASVGAPGDDVAVLPLEGPAVLVTALAADSLTLRRRLDEELARRLAAAEA